MKMRDVSVAIVICLHCDTSLTEDKCQTKAINRDIYGEVF